MGVRVKILSSVPLTAAALSGVLAGCGVDTAPCANPFDRALWMHGGSDERYLIAKRLVTCHTLVGATRLKVARLLGPPAQISNGSPTGSREWIYGLGYREAFLNPDGNQYLRVSFRPSGRVRAVAVPPEFPGGG
jgi:hypothetical protein